MGYVTLLSDLNTACSLGTHFCANLNGDLRSHVRTRKLSKAAAISKDAHNKDFASLIRDLGKKRMLHVAEKLFLEVKSQGIMPDSCMLSAMMLCYADNGSLARAQAIWDEILNSSHLPNIQLISELIDAYGNMGCFDEVTRIVHQLSPRDLELSREVWKLAISCFGKRGQLERMENMLKEMVSKGYLVNSDIGNAFITYYSTFGSLTEMETAYGRVRRSRILIEEEAIRAMSLAYIKGKKFFKLGEFLRGVGLGRKNVGNLLWNLLLLSYAVNFKMKSLQREFLGMLDAGFRPDLCTFNIRLLAYSKMSLFWDLHLSLEHMSYENVIPDLVTYGCVVDAYLDKKLARNLDFALDKMNLDDSPSVLTDPIVFEALGKGDFQVSSEAFLEFKRGRPWTYRKLIATYLKKQYRKDDIFWNY